MRLSSLLGPVTAGLSSVFTLLSTVQPSLADGLSFHRVSHPDLDLSPLGRVALTGDFDTVSLYEYTEQANQTPSNNNGSQSILTPLPNGVLTDLVDSNGYIFDMYPLPEKGGSSSDVLVAGNFTTLGGVKAPGLAKFNVKSGQVTALPDFKGSVSALLYDPDTDSIFVGGDFQHDNSSNVMVYTGDGEWKPLSFGGLNGPVTSMLKDDDGKIIFGGAFDGVGNSSHSKNKEQVINLQDATITSDAISSRSGFSSPKNVICPTSGDDGAGKTWLLADTSPGYWRAEMGFEYKPRKIRLYNTHFEGRGTKNFLLRALPDNGIMNLTYTDPDSDKKAYCDQSCPLSSNSDEDYREFTFVNNVGMSGFQIEVLDWYGSGAGLNGIELLHDSEYTLFQIGYVTMLTFPSHFGICY